MKKDKFVPVRIARMGRMFGAFIAMFVVFLLISHVDHNYYAMTKEEVQLASFSFGLFIMTCIGGALLLSSKHE